MDVVCIVWQAFRDCNFQIALCGKNIPPIIRMGKCMKWMSAVYRSDMLRACTIKEIGGKPQWKDFRNIDRL